MSAILVEGSEVVVSGAYIDGVGDESDPAIVADGVQSFRLYQSKVVGGGVSLVDVAIGVVVGCEIQSDGHGVSLSGTSDALVASNLINGPGAATDNTYDGIHLAGDSDRNHIAGNTVIPSAAANATRYGINVSAAACDDNVVADNVLGPTASYGTGAYNDAGTGTVTARDGNGQFTW